MAISIDFETSETQKLDKKQPCDNLWQIQHPFGRSQVTVPEPSEDESVARAQWWDDGNDGDDEWVSTIRSLCV